MLCLQANEACHIMPPHSMSVEVLNAPPLQREHLERVNQRYLT